MQTLKNSKLRKEDRMARQTCPQILATAAPFWDTIEKDKEEIKDCWVGCSELFTEGNKQSLLWLPIKERIKKEWKIYAVLQEPEYKKADCKKRH